jgi:hypothetical protein
VPTVTPAAGRHAAASACSRAASRARVSRRERGDGARARARTASRSSRRRRAAAARSPCTRAGSRRARRSPDALSAHSRRRPRRRQLVGLRVASEGARLAPRGRARAAFAARCATSASSSARQPRAAPRHPSHGRAAGLVPPPPRAAAPLSSLTSLSRIPGSRSWSRPSRTLLRLGRDLQRRAGGRCRAELGDRRPRTSWRRERRRTQAQIPAASSRCPRACDRRRSCCPHSPVELIDARSEMSGSGRLLGALVDSLFFSPPTPVFPSFTFFYAPPCTFPPPPLPPPPPPPFFGTPFFPPYAFCAVYILRRVCVRVCGYHVEGR